MIPTRSVFAACLLLMLCGCGNGTESASKAAAAPATVTSLSGQPLLPPSPIPDQPQLEANLADARAALKANPDDPDALVWAARRLGYPWRLA